MGSFSFTPQKPLVRLCLNDQAGHSGGLMDPKDLAESAGNQA